MHTSNAEQCCPVDSKKRDLTLAMWSGPRSTELQLRRRRRHLGRVRDEVAGPDRGHAGLGQPARVVRHRVDELTGAEPVGDRVHRDQAHHEAAARELRHLQSIGGTSGAGSGSRSSLGMSMGWSRCLTSSSVHAAAASTNHAPSPVHATRVSPPSSTNRPANG
ncbi:hypothetical protein EJB05_34027, partial [Eragrostis curvula]